MLLSGGGIPVASLNHSCVFVVRKAVFTDDRDGVAPALCSLESYRQKKLDNHHLTERRVLFYFVLFWLVISELTVCVQLLLFPGHRRMGHRGG